jgi:RNA polymerase subunit RPABC4/transcription elongation factor Spt4
MGLGNFFKRKSGAYKLPESRINKSEVITLLKRNMPFIVTLPIIETIRQGKSHSISRSQGGIRQTYYTPASKKKVFRTIETNINCEPNRIRIQHAKKNGEHIFVKYSDISIVAKLTNGKINNGVGIELNNGKQFKFVLGKEHIKAWEAMGLNPEFPIEVFYKFLLGEWQYAFQTNFSKNNIPNSNSQPKINASNKKKSKSHSKVNKSKQKEYVICHNCGKKFKVFAIKCPYCETYNDSTKNKTLYEITKETRKICPKCGYENSGNLTKCWKCGHALSKSHSNESVKTSINKWKVCQNCGENVKFTYSKCPYCNSASLKLVESMEKLPYFSPLNTLQDDMDDQWKICPRCGKQVNKEVFKCPFCHNVVFEEKKSKTSDSTKNINQKSEQGFFKSIFR